MEEGIFHIRDDLNQKVCLFEGFSWRCHVDAVVHSTNERLSFLPTDLREAAGSELEAECQAEDSCC